MRRPCPRPRGCPASGTPFRYSWDESEAPRREFRLHANLLYPNTVGLRMTQATPGGPNSPSLPNTRALPMSHASQRLFSTKFRKVVFPAPRKPVRMVARMRRSCRSSVESRRLKIASVFWAFAAGRPLHFWCYDPENRTRRVNVRPSKSWQARVDAGLDLSLLRGS